MIMTSQSSQQRTVANFIDAPKARSSLVRRLVAAHDDPGKERIRQWLMAIDNERLARFGLTPEDIALLRGVVR
jgi:hypothetical protein